MKSRSSSRPASGAKQEVTNNVELKPCLTTKTHEGESEENVNVGITRPLSACRPRSGALEVTPGSATVSPGPSRAVTPTRAERRSSSPLLFRTKSPELFVKPSTPEPVVTPDTAKRPKNDSPPKKLSELNPGADALDKLNVSIISNYMYTVVFL